MCTQMKAGIGSEQRQAHGSDADKARAETPNDACVCRKVRDFRLRTIAQLRELKQLHRQADLLIKKSALAK